MKRYYAIHTFNRATSELVPPTTYTIGYCLCSRSRNFIVTFCNPDFPSHHRSFRQQLVILPAAFHRIVSDVSRHSIAGCAEVLKPQLIDLGFVLPMKGVVHDDARIAIGT